MHTPNIKVLHFCKSLKYNNIIIYVDSMYLAFILKYKFITIFKS